MTRKERKKLLIGFLEGYNPDEFILYLSSLSSGEAMSKLTNIKDHCLLRETGRSTRIVDAMIQWFFDEQSDLLKTHDHHPSLSGNRALVDKFTQRLAFEFGKEAKETLNIEVSEGTRGVKLTKINKKDLQD